MDERAFVSRFIAAPPEQLVRLVSGVTPEQQVALGAYLGDARLQGLRQLAVQARGRKRAQGQVVFVPGFLGSALVVTREGESRTVWLEHEAIRLGWFRWLRLATDGRLPFDPGVEVRPAGVLNAFYGEILLKLAARWDVRAFAYDWRKDMSVAAAELEAFLLAEFDEGAVQIVAHSTGAMVVRAMLAMRAKSAQKVIEVDRLITLGEPTQGTFCVPRILAGLDPMVRRLGQWTALGSPGQTDSAAQDEVVKALASFPALYQMLPRPTFDNGSTPAEFETLYQAATYAPCSAVVPQVHLDKAKAFHEFLADSRQRVAVETVAVEGYGQPTPIALVTPDAIGSAGDYLFDSHGDGVVPTLGRSSGVAEIPGRYYLRATHGALASDSALIAALDDLLTTGKTARLEATGPQPSSAPSPGARWSRPRGEDPFDRLVRRLQSRAVLLGRSSPLSTVGTRLRSAASRVSPDERALEEMLAGDFHHRELDSPAMEGGTAMGTRAEPLPKIGVSLVHVGIESVHRLGEPHESLEPEGGFSVRQFLKALQACPIDAIAVGHYLGVLPQGPELALDRSISRALRERSAERIRNGGADAGELVPEDESLITQFTERGLLRSDLAQFFWLPDPRPEPADRAHKPADDRLIVIAGMGVAGRFGGPELTVLARELCWSLGRLGKRHLATVLIGAGKGNIPLADAVHAWMRGVAQAVGGLAGRHPQLERLTFAEFNASRISEFDSALSAEVDRFSQELSIEYTPKTPEELGAIRARDRQRQVEKLAERHRPHREEDGERASMRVSVQLQGDIYLFGALTSTASIPERRIPLQRWLVEAANAELAAEGDPALQLDRGQFLGHLLIPDDLRPQFFTRDPLVLMLDVTTARIHWEMMAQSEGDFAPGERPASGQSNANSKQFREEFFLGTARSLTRQLRTTFAPPPEPPPPPRRVLRVLVVADPAADAPLPGAIEEGAEVADLFEAFNTVHDGAGNRVEVVRLLGPGQATATNVLRELLSRSYDVLHFAGHCFFDPETPSASGWVFTNGQILNADLLRRIDRVPKFVFSNACESGVTPDRPGDYSDSLAPSFAEAFFQRGVSNFVCTAWPVDDQAARCFARRLYEGMLGIRLGNGYAHSTSERIAFEPMSRAMLEARLTIARNPDGTINTQGARIWGAYQHYGNPYFRFFNSSTRRHGYRS